MFDLAAIRTVAELCHQTMTPFAYLMNEFDPKRQKLNQSALKVLDTFGGYTLATPVHERIAYVQAASLGRSGQEVSDKRQREPAAAEISAVWSEIVKIMRSEGVRP